MPRYIFTVDFEDESKWSVGTDPGYKAGKKVEGRELANILRRVANEVEKWDETEEKKFAAAVKYPGRDEIS